MDIKRHQHQLPGALALAVTSSSNDMAGGNQLEAVANSRTHAAEGPPRCPGRPATLGRHGDSDVQEAVYTGAAHVMSKSELVVD